MSHYIVFGSFTSPYVRRVRMLLENIPFEFKEINLYEGVDSVEYNKINPINQIPALKDGEHTVWDSRIIFQYLNKKHQFEVLDVTGENRLTAIERAMDSAITLMLMSRSGMDITQPYMYIQRQKERIESVLNHLSPWIASEAQNTWNYSTMTLYAFLDWGMFRKMIDISKRPECQAFLTAHADRAVVKNTAIPKG